MLNESEFYCPDCDNGFDTPMPRRAFLRRVSGGAAALIGAAAARGALAADDAAPRAPKPAEDKVRELFSTLNDEQKKQLVYPWDHGDEGAPSRLLTHNSAPFGKRIRDHYTPAQQELIRRTLRSILSDDDALERLSRNGSWDSSGSFEGCGSVIYGDPTSGPFSWVFAGHHLTLRCDGNSQPNAAFGGPLYYGHSANGYASTNVYLYQTHQVHEVFDALDAKQREKAMQGGEGTDGKAALREQNPRPGIAFSALSGDQQQLVTKVMRVLLDPFRKEDADEAMQIVKDNGGMQHMQLAFYGEVRDERQRWNCWRLEGPGFIWNFRVLPHVHTFVNVVKL
jgi:hypothetical protein